jgi:hypothetical protein
VVWRIVSGTEDESWNSLHGLLRRTCEKIQSVIPVIAATDVGSATAYGIILEHS